MPHKGGPANISGVEYEQWFVAYMYSEAFFNSSIEVIAQARYIKTGQPEEEEKLASIDDVVVFKEGEPTFIR